MIKYPPKPYLCQDCGETDPLQFYRRAKGRCKKCVCIQAKSNGVEYKKSKKYYLANVLKIRVLMAKKRAIDNNLPFDIDVEFMKILLDKQENKCSYSGRQFDNGSHLNSVSIDRIDSNKGYTKDNVQLVTSAINYMKKAMTHFEFLSFISDVYNNYNI